MKLVKIKHFKCNNCKLEIEAKEFIEYNDKYKYEPKECPTCKGQVFEVFFEPIKI